MPSETPSGKGLYLTVYHSSRPNTDTVSSLTCPYNQVEKVDKVSPMSLMRCESISVVELALGGSSTKKSNLSAIEFLHKLAYLLFAILPN